MLQITKKWRFSAMLVLASIIYLWVFYRTAWLSDDAYITYRSIDNILQGHGLTFNVGQRVQAFTHPLWALIHIPVYAAWRDIYGVGLLLSMGTSLAVVVLTLKLFAKKWTSLAFLLLAMICSAALMDFSSSGLENPMTHLLLVIFCGIYVTPSQKHRLFWLSLLAGLILLNRMDSILLIAPALAVTWWPQRSFKTFWVVLAGLSVFLFWEVFAIIYYGFPFPMTAYAKLNTGIELIDRLQQGLWYFQDSIQADPLTLLMILAGTVMPWVLKRKAFQSLSIGLGLYLLYILYIGGDFMSGRFFSSPYLFALIIISSIFTEKSKLYLLPLVLLLSIFFASSPLRSHADFGIDRTQKLKLIGSHGISNERAFYFQGTGLIAAKGRKMPDMDFVEEGKTLSRYKTGLYLSSNMGMKPFYAGPGLYFIDRFALTDPFRAHLPALYHPSGIPGHNFRLLPTGYIESLEQKKNLLESPPLYKLYEATETITRSPLWEKARLRAIWDMNITRKYTRALDKSFFYLPVTRKLSPEELSDSNFSITLAEDKAIEIQLPWEKEVKGMKLLVENNCSFVFVLRYGKEIVGNFAVIKVGEKGSFSYFHLTMPASRKSNIVIYPLNGGRTCQIKEIQFEYADE